MLRTVFSDSSWDGDCPFMYLGWRRWATPVLGVRSGTLHVHVQERLLALLLHEDLGPPHIDFLLTGPPSFLTFAYERMTILLVRGAT